MKKILLTENEMPTRWYNILADMPNKPHPPLHPGTKEPIKPEDLAPLFPMGLIEQEMSPEQYIDIPGEVLELYRSYRPSPMFRATGLEKAIGTNCKIYYKYEGGSYAGSHKANTAIAQAYYNKAEGVKKMTTETGAGQWGSALSFACQYFGIDLEVFMVKISYQQKPYRKVMMNTYNTNVVPSPSTLTDAGNQILAQNPDSPGSLGIAISEAVERAAKDPEIKYSLGSVLNHVLLHQTVIGEEAIKQMEIVNDYPDIVVGCFGGGSNFAGISFPFIRENILNGRKTRAVAVEPASCPKLTKGRFLYDFGDSVGMTPLLAMYTLGHNFVPARIHAGGLRYHGAGVIVSQLLKDGLMEAQSKYQKDCFKNGVLFARNEGIIPAPESTYAITGAIDEARKCDEAGEQKTILFNLSGHGHLDLSAYEKYFSDDLEDHELTNEEIEASISKITGLAPEPAS